MFTLVCHTIISLREIQKGEFCTLGLQQVRSAKAFGAVTAPLSPCPAPAGGFCSYSMRNQRLSPAESGRKTSLPHPSQRSRWVSPRVLRVPAQLRSASSTRERRAEGKTDRRGSGGAITSPTTPARFARIHLPDPLVRQKKVSLIHLRGWVVAFSKPKTCCSSEGASEGSHPSPDFVASSLLTLEKHQRR